MSILTIKQLFIFVICISLISSFKRSYTKLCRSSHFLKSTIEKIDLTNDGGVVKELISKGGGKQVDTGDILAIKYQAYLKDSNKIIAKGEKETCIVKDGSLIKGWDIGISSMNVGEKAKITLNSKYAYGSKGVDPIIPPDSDIVLDLHVLAMLGNQLQPDSLFQKDLDIDPFVASTPETIQDEFDKMQANKVDKYKGNIFQIYFNRIKNISFGFGGSGRYRIYCHFNSILYSVLYYTMYTTLYYTILH